MYDFSSGKAERDSDIEFTVGNTLFEVLVHRSRHFSRKENTVHNHHANELMVILDGNIFLKYGKNEYTATKNNVIYVPKHLHHFCYYEDCTYFSICFSIKRTKGTKQRREDTYSLFEKAFNDKTSILLCDKSTLEFFYSFPENILNYSTLSYYLVQNEIRKFFILLAEKISVERNLSKDVLRPLGTVNFLIYEEMYYGKNSNLNLTDLAKESYISERQLSRIVKKMFGVSFQRRKIQLKIESAREYLEKTNEPIEAIASTLNYCDSASFIRAFKREVGVTPLQYRRAIEKNNPPACSHRKK